MNKLAAGLLLALGIVAGAGANTDVASRFNLARYAVNGVDVALPPTATFTVTIQGPTISYRAGDRQVTGQFVKSREVNTPVGPVKSDLYENVAANTTIEILNFRVNGNTLIRQTTTTGGTQYLYVYQIVRSAQQPLPPPADPKGEGLVVKANSASVAGSCAAIMMAASAQNGLLTPQENSRVLTAATSFLKKNTEGFSQLIVSGDRSGAQIAQEAATTTNRRIQALPPAQRNQAILDAVNQCLGTH